MFEEIVELGAELGRPNIAVSDYMCDSAGAAANVPHKSPTTNAWAIGWGGGRLTVTSGVVRWRAGDTEAKRIGILIYDRVRRCPHRVGARGSALVACMAAYLALVIISAVLSRDPTAAVIAVFLVSSTLGFTTGVLLRWPRRVRLRVRQRQTLIADRRDFALRLLLVIASAVFGGLVTWALHFVG